MSKPMTRWAIIMLDDSDALAVALHGLRQYRMGKQPSVPFNGQANPRRALAAALAELGYESIRQFSSRHGSPSCWCGTKMASRQGVLTCMRCDHERGNTLAYYRRSISSSRAA